MGGQSTNASSDSASVNIDQRAERVQKIEFAVNMTCGNCESAVRKALSTIDGVSSVQVNVNEQRVLVTTTQPSSTIQKALETTGMLAVLKGQGQGQGQQHLGAAVSIIKCGQNVLGLVRFLQTTRETCIVDYSFNGLQEGRYGLHVHEYGDLSQGCDSTGDDYDSDNNPAESSRPVGILGNVEALSNETAVSRFEDSNLKLWDIIGRSVVLHEKEDDLSNDPHGNAGKGIGCGIIARSAGLFQNKKMVCTCTGKTIWQERKEAREEMG